MAHLPASMPKTALVVASITLMTAIVAVVILQSVTENGRTALDTVNQNTTLNISQNTNSAAAQERQLTFFRTVSNECEIDYNCILANSEEDYSACCGAPSCPPTYTEDRWVASNRISFNAYLRSLQAEQQCTDVECPDYSKPTCEGDTRALFEARCIEGICQKVPR